MIQPKCVTLLPGGQQEFTCQGADTWIISPQFGAIAPEAGAPGTGRYRAPRFLLLSRTIAVIATARGTEIDRASVTISSAGAWMTVLAIFWALVSIGLIWAVTWVWPPPPAPPAVAVYPPVATLPAGEALQFLSSATGAGDAAVIWTASEGEITPTGVFTAPGAPSGKPVTVTATRNSDRTQSAAAQVLVRPTKMIMNRSVVNATGISRGGKIQFTAIGPPPATGALQWYLTGPGRLGANGLYTVEDKAASEAVITVVDPSTDRKAAAVVHLSSVSEQSDLTIIYIVLLMGAFGALLAGMRSFVNFVGNRDFAPSWSFYYFSRPMFGAGVALIVFFAYRIGAINGPKGTSPADPFAAAFVAGVVGLFADTVLQKLREIVVQLFRPEDERKDKLGAAAAPRPPAITKLVVSGTALTISGSDFTAQATVTINGNTVASKFVSGSEITVALPAALAASGSKLEVVVVQDGVKSKPMSTQIP